MKNPLQDFHISPKDIEYLGENLQRPECILAERNGTLWTADARGGVVKIDPDGTQSLITQQKSNEFAERGDEHERFVSDTLPNGLAFAKNGDILIANFGTDRLELMKRTGETEILYDNIKGNLQLVLEILAAASKNGMRCPTAIPRRLSQEMFSVRVRSFSKNASAISRCR